MGLLRRKSASNGQTTKLYYASDIHGSEVLWRKFLAAGPAYRAEVLVMGGDVTGKAVVPLVLRDDGYHLQLFGERQVVGAEEVEDAEHRIRANGMYPVRMTDEEISATAGFGEDELEEWFAQVMRRTFDGWLDLAGERLGASTRCFVMPGNDDPHGIDASIEAAEKVEACDGRIVEFGPYTMVSLGYANPTPFDSPRELSEEDIFRRVSALAAEVDDLERCVFNLHVPPYDSSLDTAPELTDDLEVVMSGGAPKMIPVGSTAVRELIETYQPMLSLHGHVHESAGATRIGRTLSVNPGSDYHTGRIAGCLFQLTPEGVRHQFVTG